MENDTHATGDDMNARSASDAKTCMKQYKPPMHFKLRKETKNNFGDDRSAQKWSNTFWIQVVESCLLSLFFSMYPMRRRHVLLFPVPCNYTRMLQTNRSCVGIRTPEPENQQCRQMDDVHLLWACCEVSSSGNGRGDRGDLPNKNLKARISETKNINLEITEYTVLIHIQLHIHYNVC